MTEADDLITAHRIADGLDEDGNGAAAGYVVLCGLLMIAFLLGVAAGAWLF